MNENKYNKIENTKEEFCGACLAVPMALVGAGASVAGANQKGTHKKMKKYMLWGGILTIIISILIAVYFISIKKCNSCIK
jgi:uncharacterized membrane protein YjfL (UPF0719 family)